ncbi:phosphoglycerate mutase family protein [Dictyocaulus viviparus]|uniref:Phosphoglycerate mutase family protein n=1 Tax=Dictyocaulus viviparus TaxID=29172 RepID=A0A0D8XD15_DICVI|nr:phosphoglycerate mutase family protein [Dictyocaulus viviparus]
MIDDDCNEQVGVPNVIALVGLPARGKTYISHKLCRYLNWIGIKTKAFNVGDYRRKAINYEVEGELDFFSPYNAIGTSIRNECARLAIEDMGRYLEAKEGEVAILDATNTTRARRRFLMDYCRRAELAPAFRVFFIESVCDDPDIINSNITEVKINSPDYKGKMSEEEAKEDFMKRIENYKLQYEPIDQEIDDDLSFIKVMNAGKSFFVHNVKGHIQSRVVYFLMNIHLLPRSIYLTRHGESEYNQIGRLGGDSPLSENGLRYAERLKEYFMKESLEDLRVWSSQKIRAVQTASRIQELATNVEYWKVLDEIDAGICEGLTYEDFEARYPKQFAERDKDKYHYRYPSGESYEDLVARLEPVIMELERQSDVLVVSHQAVLRCILAYFTNKNREELPYLKVPLHTVIKLTPKAYSCEVEMFKFDVDAVNTYREKPGHPVFLVNFVLSSEFNGNKLGRGQWGGLLSLTMSSVYDVPNLGAKDYKMSDEWGMVQIAALRSGPTEKQFSGQFPGERIEVIDRNIGYLSPIGKISGRVLITRYRLRFEGSDNACHFEVPLGCICKVEKVGHSTVSRSEHSYGVLIGCKDMRNIRFTCQPATHSRRPLYDALLRYAFPVTNKLPLYAFLYAQALQESSPPPHSSKPMINGWTLYDAKIELNRLGVPNEQWALSQLNHDYEFADTYPRLLAIPSAVEGKGRDFIEKVGEYRSRQRIPIIIRVQCLKVLSWLHPVTQASITRCSQPKSGMTNRKCAEDEWFLKQIVLANANAHQLLIFDARPIVNAKVNKAKGGGYEESYEECALLFLNIHNIHVVRESLRKLKDCLFPRVDEKNYLKLVDESKWLNHIQSIIEGAAQIVSEVERNRNSVLVHCSDGWDRTAQLTSLAMVQLDPYYRTIKGFAVLIEKEWCSFGHKFAHRIEPRCMIGHGEDKPSDGERSPVFHGCHFEFNSFLLVTILDELYACRFGTFLFNSEKQRLVDNKCIKNTVSLWTYVLENKALFLNPLYNKGDQRTVLSMNSSMRVLRVWTEYYARYNPHVIAPGSLAAKRYALQRACGKRALVEELVSLSQA